MVENLKGRDPSGGRLRSKLKDNVKMVLLRKKTGCVLDLTDSR
jgi:hypothetical protein